jgi:hypothetical protein
MSPRFIPAFVTGLIGPLLFDGAIGYVKGFYDRPTEESFPGLRRRRLMAAAV